MTQVEFNEMLQVALSQGLSGYYTSKYTGEEIDRRLDNAVAPVVNDNILDNAFWGNPVNQRGQTVYTGTGDYSIDRWYRGYVGATLTLMDGYIQFTGANNAELFQRLEDLFLGEELTASVLLKDNTLFSVSARMPSEYTGGYLNTDIDSIIPGTNGARINLSYYDNRLRFILNCSSGAILEAVAAKLELGNEQTIARQDENGKWILLKRGKFPESLAQCQYYAENIPIYFAISNGNLLELFVPYKSKKRISPTVKVSTVSTQDEGKAEYYDGSGWISFPVAVSSFTNGFRIYSNSVPAQNAIIQFKAFVSCDL